MDQNINPIGIAYVAGPETRARLQASRDARRTPFLHAFSHWGNAHP